MLINRKLIIIIFLTLGLAWEGGLLAQTYLYFQDSPSTDLYDYSWMELTPPSELERKGSDLRRFPVESILSPVQGTNSLRLKWKSVSGGDWVAIAAGMDWTAKDISQTDTLLFWLNSAEDLNSSDLPKIFLEDVDNVKTTKHDFSAWSPSTITAGVWLKITIPMSVFLDAGDPVDFTNIKTIGFAQNLTDGIMHTLFIDDMRVFAGDGTSPPASQPTGVVAEGYDSHIDVSWNANPESFLNGYMVQRSTDGGISYSTVSVTDKNTLRYIDWVKPLGTEVSLVYRIYALNAANEPSEPSTPASATTHFFSDEEFLDMVQEYTFRYFYDYAHPLSGMIRERNNSGDVVTIGGSGFGIMALLVGVERGFITRQEGIDRLKKILTFLENSDRFHGAWPHWINGSTGDVIPFSTKDNGGDLVETGFLVEGLLTARQYFNLSTPDEQEIASRITNLWESVEWDWYTKNNSGVLYWHWSPNFGWQINMQIRGWNEASIIYMLAIASPTHSIPSSYWNNGWAGTSYYINGGSFYGHKLEVGWDYGGPLFFAHYSFLGFDPRSKKDDFTNYFILNRNHTLINRAYCIDNPKNYTGYNENCWGLTASDDPDGYMAHEPTSSRDNGTITPTAALSSIPYTPAESLGALKYFYRELGQKTWGPMGFYDAFNQSRNWWATSYLAIDQGPIIGMIENHRSGLLWNNFMANPEINSMMDAIGFTYDANSVNNSESDFDFDLFPNPAVNGYVNLSIKMKSVGLVTIQVIDITGRVVSEFEHETRLQGINAVPVDVKGLAAGLYTISLTGPSRESGLQKLLIGK
ncbi:MAG: glucoamylase family protein [Bacteroidota bacterium]